MAKLSMMAAPPKIQPTWIGVKSVFFIIQPKTNGVRSDLTPFIVPHRSDTKIHNNAYFKSMPT
jgi:hypothetical protein